jgi:phosphoribosylformimino-5-aminoimidazole carboxamide ribotide isomerase
VVIVPSVDVRDGRVAYRGGAGANEQPLALAKRYVADGADELHLVDLDGAEARTFANFDLLAGVARDVGIPCRLAGGIASVEQARAAIDAGFTGVLFSSAVFGDDAVLRRCARFERAIVEIEARDGRLAPRGGAPELVLLAKGMDAKHAARTASLRGVRALYVIDLSTDGRLGGPPIVLMEELRREAGKDVAFHTGGGVRDLNDIRALAEWGAASVVVGRAFLEGRFTVAEAKAACA